VKGVPNPDYPKKVSEQYARIPTHSKGQGRWFKERRQRVRGSRECQYIKNVPPTHIAIMRVFVRLREMMATHKELAFKLIELEERLEGHDEQIQNIFEAIRRLMTPPEPARKKIGFEAKEAAAPYGKGKGSGVRKQVCDGNF
jgi:hypothetical protein